MRYRLTLALLVIGFFLVTLRLFYWQVVRADEMGRLGQQQYAASSEQTIVRGEIQTSDNFPIATNKLSYLAYINPKQIGDKEKVSQVLASVLDMDGATISARLAQDKFWVPLAQNLSIDKKIDVETLAIPGVGFQEQSLRFYPEGSLSAHMIGFVGKDSLGDAKGYFGLEGYYDRQLRGKPGTSTVIRDAFGKPILAKTVRPAKGTDGRTLTLSIDRAIQFIVEHKLKVGVEKYGAAGGMVGVMDPKTGNILAMSSFPSFDPGTYTDFPPEYYKNPFISNTFEPGSTFKSLVMSAALDAKVVKPQTPCPICAGPVSVGGYDIKTWNDKYQANESMIDVIKNSDNTGMVFVGKALGFDRFLSYLNAFGIGQLTGIDLQGEVGPSMKSPDLWYPIDVATATFGQGITVTPIELLDAFAAIANAGKRMEPHVVSQITTADNETVTIAPKVLATPISEEASKVMTEILVNAVNKGESKWTRLKGYRIAGKTGTAQIPIAGHYDATKTIASFIGFAPADDPKFVMLVIVDRPTTSIYGAETAAPIFMDIARDILMHDNIAPTEGE